MTTSDHRRIVLASASPRRRELLTHIGFDPIVVPANVPEVMREGETPEDYTMRLAETKAAASAAVVEQTDPEWILAADTIVTHDGAVLEKPADAEDAIAMLSTLAGDWHEVVTGFCWLNRVTGAQRCDVVTTEVLMRTLTPEWILRYVQTGEPMDKAGGYGIQDIGAAIVEEVRGSYSSVVGLPLCEVVETLEELGGLPHFPFRTDE